MSILLPALLCVFVACMVWAAATDVMGYRITNLCNLVLAAAFVPFAAVVLLGAPAVTALWPDIAFGWSDLAWHVAGAFAMLAVGFVLFLPGIIGAGDAKLIAATTLWIGPAALTSYMLSFAVIGGLVALAIIIWRRFPLPAVLAQTEWATHAHDRKTPIPYGLALAPGGIMALASSPWAALLIV